MTTKAEQLIKARNKDCAKCSLSSTTTGNVCVFGRGNHDAVYFLIGEAPGAKEEETGKPFMGRSGRLLDLMLQECGIYDLCYISNSVRCRPPHNRDPSTLEIEACREYLLREIHIIQPQVLIALGRVAKKALGYADSKMGDVGEWLIQRSGLMLPVVFTYHPAFCGRNGKPAIHSFYQHIRTAKEIYETLQSSD